MIAFNLLVSMKNRVSYLTKFRRLEEYYLLIWNMNILENILQSITKAFLKTYKINTYIVPTTHQALY